MSDRLYLHIDAVDTLMFRDGRPFNQADAGASEAISVFPPHPPTVVGAVRAAIWREMGAWDKTVLGDGTDWRDNNTLGALHFTAPLIVREKSSEAGKTEYEPLFPVPLHVVEGSVGDKEKPLTRLQPGPARQCDLGSARLPVPEQKLSFIKVIEDRFVTAAGMKKILDGVLPEQEALIDCGTLWQREPRVGVGIDRETRMTSDGQLYMASHIRMANGVSLAVCLDDADHQRKGFARALIPLAGEHRMADIKSGPAIVLPACPKTLDSGRYCAIQISPMVLDDMPRPGGNLCGLPGTLVSACLGKPVSIGGWNSSKRKPIPLRQAIPAGSVWFFQDADNTALDWHGRSIGIGEAWGFGQVLIGTWQEGAGS